MTLDTKDIPSTPAYATNTGSFQGSLSRVYLAKRSNKKILSGVPILGVYSPCDWELAPSSEDKMYLVFLGEI